ncbi:MAG: M24 family metallopeptidase [Hyphomonas oceanitis]|uniref:M24 family metallopeptidase n=1 Tax=Hyphomonas oceanitis TaxID=81033 RepID=UPI0030022989
MESLTDDARLAALIEAEDKALTLFDAIEAAGIIAPGRSEAEVDGDIAALALETFGIERHWHQCNVRAGANTVTTFHDKPPLRVIAPEDTVYVDLGPVFAEWEADVGRTYAVGESAAKHALVGALDTVFEAVRAEARPDMTGAALYALACRMAEAHGYVFGGAIAGHVVAEFPHAVWPGDKDQQRISPNNRTRLSDPDPFGRTRHWILEIHLLEPGRTWGGFYERLLRW